MKNYWSATQIKKCEAQWNMIFGKRSNGKSYGVKNEIINDAIANIDNEYKKRFFYVRRYSEDVDVFSVLQYLKDFEIVKDGKKKSKIQEISNNRFNAFKVAKKKIFVLNRDEEGNESDIQHIGYYANIGNAERLKTQSYLDVENIVFEEFIASSKPYLPREPQMLESIVSTVARNREIKVWLIGNNDDRDCIYFNYFGLEHVKKQKEGTIEVYEHDNYDEDTGEHLIVKIAVEFCGNSAGKSGMFFGKGAEIIETGNWRSEKQPIMFYEDFEECEKIYHVVFSHNGIHWDAWLCSKNNGFFWYVQEKTRPIKRNTRVVSDMISTDPLYSSNLYPLNNGEKKAFELLKNGKVFFHDSLTGTEFKRALKFFTENSY